jgi:polar amino acid transport system substrate-binding protein
MRSRPFPIVLLVALFAAWPGIAGAQDADKAARGELAPTGALRVGIIETNPIVVVRDPADNRLRGFGVDVGRALAERLGAAFTPVAFGSGRELFEALKDGRIDLGFLAVAPARAAEVDFAPPLIEVESTFMVPPGSPILATADIDRPGVRVAAIEKSSQDFHLTKTLKHATVVRLAGGATERGIELLRSGQIEAFAGNTHRLAGALAQVPGARVLPGRFLKADYTIALPKGRAAGLPFVARFVADAKTSGLAAGAITRAGLRGVVVAP